MCTNSEKTLISEVEDFRAWAVGREGTYGEWECDYPNWSDIYAAVRAVLAQTDLSPRTILELLYALARDNECGVISEMIHESGQLGRLLAAGELQESEPDARWQLAVLLGRRSDQESIAMLRRYVDDSDEYVRRRALLAATLHDAAFAEDVAWSRLRDPAEYTRLAALSVLVDLHSHRLSTALETLKEDPSIHVQAAVQKCLNERAG